MLLESRLRFRSRLMIPDREYEQVRFSETHRWQTGRVREHATYTCSFSIQWIGKQRKRTLRVRHPSHYERSDAIPAETVLRTHGIFCLCCGYSTHHRAPSDPKMLLVDMFKPVAYLLQRP